MAQQLEVLNVKSRDTQGKRHARRLRRAGSVPAVLYGHGEKSVSLALPGDELEAVVRHREHQWLKIRARREGEQQTAEDIKARYAARTAVTASGIPG